jgi:superfamily I DNA/RNA helicase
MQLTTEQQGIIDDVKGGQHVSVTALPGSGKSRVAYELIRQCTDDHSVVLIMYNRSLCDATTEHLGRLDIDTARKVKAFTFHGLASSLTGTACHNDRQIVEVLKSKTQPEWYMDDFTLLIIDEGQDMRPGFMQLVHYMLQSACVNRARLRIVLLGDPRQLLYGFYNHNRADARFLSLGHVLLRPVNKRTWEQRQLTRSFRSTVPVTNFLNVLIPGHRMLSSGNAGPPVTLDVCNLRTFEPAAKILRIVSRYPPEDVLVLCSTLGPTSPARKLVRTLVRHGSAVHVQRSGPLRDTSPVPLAGHTGRIRFKTFCASKGLEAKLVIVLNGRSLFQGIENSLYVALSRSMQELVIFQDVGPTSVWNSRRSGPSLPAPICRW